MKAKNHERKEERDKYTMESLMESLRESLKRSIGALASKSLFIFAIFSSYSFLTESSSACNVFTVCLLAASASWN